MESIIECFNVFRCRKDCDMYLARECMSLLDTFTLKMSLHHFIQKGDVFAVDAILKKNFIVDMEDAICRAVTAGHLRVVKYFARKVDQKAINKALICAAEHGHFNIVHYLFSQKDADINYDDSCALQMAVNGGFYDIVRYLVENGANVHGDNNGALHMAIDRGHLDIVKYLVDNGADIDNWARYIANYYNNADIIRYLDTYLPL